MGCAAGVYPRQLRKEALKTCSATTRCRRSVSLDEPVVIGSSEANLAEAGTASAALEVAGPTAGYSTVPIVEGVDITVREGELVLLVGPNGTGKFKVLKVIDGVIRRLDGQVRVLGRKVGGNGPAAMARAGVAYVLRIAGQPSTSPIAAPRTSSPSSRSSSPITRGGSSRTTLPHVPQVRTITPWAWQACATA